MKRITSLSINNFKYFEGNNLLDFQNKQNILIYGENGSGKSSIFWAFHILLNACLKDQQYLEKKLDKNSAESIANYHARNDAEIELSIQQDNGPITTYKINKVSNDCRINTEILESLLSTDFYTYKEMLCISSLKASQDLDLFDYFKYNLFETKYELWKWSGKRSSYSETISFLNSVPKRMPYQRTATYNSVVDAWLKANEEFNANLGNLIKSIALSANEILSKIEPSLSFEFIIAGGKHNTAYKTYRYQNPLIWIKLKYQTRDIIKPHVHLNEGKLSILMQSIRLSITKERYNPQNVNLLLLDDFIISLDMNNRMGIMSYLIKEFEGFQIVLMTHDRAFFDLLSSQIRESNNWQMYEVTQRKVSIGTGIFDKPFIVEHKDYMGRANKHFDAGDYPASANYLRKQVESVLNKKTNHHSLDDKLGLLELQEKSGKIKVQASSLIDEINNCNVEKMIDQLSKSGKCEVCKRFLRRRHSFLSDKASILKQELSSDRYSEVKSIKSRILNPHSHDDINTPLYRDEMIDAIDIVEKFSTSK